MPQRWSLDRRTQVPLVLQELLLFDEFEEFVPGGRRRERGPAETAWDLSWLNMNSSDGWGIGLFVELDRVFRDCNFLL